MNKVLSLSDLKKILDHHFGVPFLSEDLVSTNFIERDEGDALEITIDRRTIVIDYNGSVSDTCTAVTYTDIK